MRRYNYLKFLVLILILMLMAGCGTSISTTPSEPVINSFTADPLIITISESSTLSWNVSDATNVSIDQGVGSSLALSSSASVSPTATTTYTLTATNDTGTVTATVEITVAAITYTVTFDSQGGSVVSSQVVGDGGLVTEPTPPTKTDYAFAGWYKELECINAWDFATDTVISDVTLYAKWTTNAYTVTFDKNGGNTEANPEIKIVEYGGNVGTLPIAPSRTGYTFTSWNTKENGNGTEFMAITAVTADITVYAQWTINSYTVTYNGNGNIAGTTPVDSSSPYEYGATVTVLGNTGTLVKIGYTFDGWNTLANSTGTDQAEGSIFTMSAFDVTLFAKWTINSYIVTFNSQGGSAVNSQMVGVGKLVTEPTAPTKTGYTFSGWYKESGCTNAWVFDTDTVTSNVTLFAKWTPLYALRDTGPAGGWIFYIKEGGYSDGWMYLEAAFSDQSVGTQWGCKGTSISGADGTAVGTGKQNTIDIEAGCATAGTAADICATLISLGGYDDWFLPSKDELNLMYTNLKVAGVGGFTTWYWSSSEFNTEHAYVQYFLGGGQGTQSKDVTAIRVRAVRCF